MVKTLVQLKSNIELQDENSENPLHIAAMISSIRFCDAFWMPRRMSMRRARRSAGTQFTCFTGTKVHILTLISRRVLHHAAISCDSDTALVVIIQQKLSLQLTLIYTTPEGETG